MEKLFLSRKQAAAYLAQKGLSRSEKTLAKYASIGGGPKFRKFGTKQVVYAVEDLNAWIDEQLSEAYRASGIKK